MPAHLSNEAVALVLDLAAPLVGDGLAAERLTTRDVKTNPHEGTG
jgi:hypothetical protein